MFTSLTNWARRARSAIRPRTRWRSLRGAPPLYREHGRYALRCAFKPEIMLPMWVTSLTTGTRFFLSQDAVDDTIARHIIQQPDGLFPPRDQLEAKGCILDIGGHHGFYGAEALRRYPERKVVVVEPHPTWCRLIKRNLAANAAAERFRIINSCLAMEVGKQTLHFDKDKSAGASVQPGAIGGLSMEVASLTLQDILQGEQASMIYCNAEGGEYSLIAQLVSSDLRPEIMIICIHPEYGDAEDLRLSIQELGYLETDVSRSPRRPMLRYTRNKKFTS